MICCSAPPRSARSFSWKACCRAERSSPSISTTVGRASRSVISVSKQRRQLAHVVDRAASQTRDGALQGAFPPSLVSGSSGDFSCVVKSANAFETRNSCSDSCSGEATRREAAEAEARRVAAEAVATQARHREAREQLDERRRLVAVETFVVRAASALNEFASIARLRRAALARYNGQTVTASHQRLSSSIG